MIWSLICLNCRRPAPRALCLACWQQVIPAESQWLELSLDEHLFSHWAYGSYQGVLKALLYQLKYHHRKALGKALGLYLGEWLETKNLVYDWIIPVPLHIQRQKERGFNQAELLARGLSQISGRPMRKSIRRELPTPPLYDQSPAEREATLHGAFALNKPLPNRIQAVLLVDDILTTGSTLKEIAHLLWSVHPSLQITSLSLARA